MKFFTILSKFFKNMVEFFHDFRDYSKYNIDGTYTSTKEKMISLMLLNAHALEKGMCFRVKKKDWGEGKARTLLLLLKNYEQFGHDEYFVMSLNVLYKYIEDSDSSKKQDLLDGIKEMTMKYKDIMRPNEYGVKEVGHIKEFNMQEIVRFFQSRMSVRFYKDNDVLEDDIMQAYEIAKLTPTACNRQTCKIYVIKDAILKKQILENQLGPQGWADKAPVLFVVTSDLSRFGGTYEHSQALVDGGLFAMNFVWGLHLNGIASCFKMFIREHKKQREFQKICGIPPKEIPIVLILGGYYKEENVLCPMSHRINNQIIFRN